jgi:Transposase and inactivated derivatives
LSGSGSLLDMCSRYAISDTKVIRGWIQKYIGCEELKARGEGRDIYMTKGRVTTLDERIEIVSYCIANGKDYNAVIEKYGVSYQQIYSWVRKYDTKDLT